MAEGPSISPAVWAPLKEKLIRDVMEKLIFKTKFTQPDGRIKAEDFIIKQKLADGRRGQVCKGEHRPTGTEVIMKIMSKEDFFNAGVPSQSFTEICLQSIILHPYVLSLYGVDDSRGEYFYYFEEYAIRRDLPLDMKRLKRLRYGEKNVAKYTCQIALALMEVHRLGFVHGNLKPAHIYLCSENNVKLTGFNLAWPIGKPMTRDICGTKDYLPPEVFRKEGYSTAVDVWSLGAVCFELLYGLNPFFRKNKKRSLRLILNARFFFPDLNKPEAQDLISKMLKKNPAERITLAEIVSHPWVIKNYAPLEQQ